MLFYFNFRPSFNNWCYIWPWKFFAWVEQTYLLTPVKYPQKVATKMDSKKAWASFAIYRKSHIYLRFNPLPITYSQHPHFHKQWNFQF